MTQEEKTLKVKDLCARLPYGVKVQYTSKLGEVIVKELRGSDIEVLYDGYHPERYKPYLRPMSSMTEEERLDLSKLTNEQFKFYLYTNIPQILCCGGSQYNYLDGLSIIDWLNAHHFDYRGLISMGLAIEAPKDMYKI